MKSTRDWLGEVVALLEECVRSKKLSSLGTLQDHFRRVDFPAALESLGCDEKCAACDWALEGAHPLQSPCRLAAFQEAILGMDAADRLSAPLQMEARELLWAIKKSPLPRKG